MQESKPWLENYRLYTSREYEAELDLYYYRHRYYDAKLGKFINRDPLLYIDGPNPYSYVNNNPVNYTDAWGLSTEQLLTEDVPIQETIAIPDVTGDFVNRLIAAANRSHELNNKYPKKSIADCGLFISLPSCISSIPIYNTYVEAMKYYEYVGQAFSREEDGWNLKYTEYAPHHLGGSTQLQVGDQIRTYDKPGNFLAGYALAAANLNLGLINNASGLNALRRELQDQFRDLSIEDFVDSMADEFNDQEMISLGYKFYQTYGTNISAEILTSFLGG